MVSVDLSDAVASGGREMLVVCAHVFSISVNLCTRASARNGRRGCIECRYDSGTLCFFDRTLHLCIPCNYWGILDIGYVTCGATVIANHHGVDARCRTVRISWYEGSDGWFQIKVFKANGRWSPNSQWKTAVAQVVLESLSHDGKHPLSRF